MATRLAHGRSADVVGWLVALVLLGILTGGVALAVGGVRALHRDRDTLRNVTRPSAGTFGLAQRPESPIPAAPPAPPPPPPPRPAPAPRLVWPRDAGAKRTVVAPATDAGQEIRKVPPPDAGAPEPEPEPEPQTSVKPPPQPVPVACGMSWCPPGQICCNPSCGICAPPGVECSQRDCRQFNVPISMQCGMNTCNIGEECCNWSCGTCVRQGQDCDRTPCDKSMTLPTAILCGMNTCSTGYECCNPSCGTCVRPGETCSHEPCWQW